MSQTTDRDRFEQSLPRLKQFLANAGQPVDDLAIVRQFDAGQSNPTYLLGSRQGPFVLRKRPYGVPPGAAHNVAREYRIMHALGAEGFQVPHVRALCQDLDVIGTDFFTVDFVEGAVFSDPALPGESAASRAAKYRALAGGLADLHRTSVNALERAGVKRHPDFIQRQITIWRNVYVEALTSPDDRVDAVANRLRETSPSGDRCAIVHGDYRVENVIFKNDTLAAVLDWELCSIGDPFADLAYCCLSYHLPNTMPNGLQGHDLKALGIPDESEFLALYGEAAESDPVPFHRFFLALSFFRLAAILQGVMKRSIEGNAASSQAQERGAMAGYCLQKACQFAGVI